jgi:hypothetical protein
MAPVSLSERNLPSDELLINDPIAPFTEKERNGRADPSSSNRHSDSHRNREIRTSSAIASGEEECIEHWVIQPQALQLISIGKCMDDCPYCTRPEAWAACPVHRDVQIDLEHRNRRDSVDRLIHQIWIGPAKRPDWTQGWADLEGWDYRLWDEAAIDTLNLRHRWLYDCYVAEGCWNGAANIARIEILQQHGGLYIDADTELVADARVRTQTLVRVERAWDALDSWRGTNAAWFVRAAVPIVQAGARQVANLTGAYLAQYAAQHFGGSFRPVPLDLDTVTGTALRGVDPAEVYLRPFRTLWTTLSQGKSLADAVDAGWRARRPSRHGPPARQDSHQPQHLRP